MVRYVLVKAPCECTTGIIERGLRSRDDNARGAAECVIDSRDRKPRSIIPVVYERERCFNWFVARFEPGKSAGKRRSPYRCSRSYTSTGSHGRGCRRFGGESGCGGIGAVVSH